MYSISREINMNVHKIAYTVTVCILLLCYAIVCNIKFHVNITESFKIKCCILSCICYNLENVPHDIHKILSQSITSQGPQLREAMSVFYGVPSNPPPPPPIISLVICPSLKCVVGKGNCFFSLVRSSILYSLVPLNNTYRQHIFFCFMNKRSYSVNWYQNSHHLNRTAQTVTDLSFLMLVNPIWIQDTFVLKQVLTQER
jgi:hypothetical protein